MYSYEDRKKAVALYIKYDLCCAETVRVLGYPGHKTLMQWYREYIQTCDLKKASKRKPKYTEEQKSKSLEHYLEHGRCIARTARALGYPSRQRLQDWVDEAFPNRTKRCISGNSLVKHDQTQKEQAAIDLCVRTCPASEIASNYGVTRETLYKWRGHLFDEGGMATMPKKQKSEKPSESEKSISDLLAEKAILEKQVTKLERDVSRLQLERDVLEKMDEVLKKGPGISLHIMTNREKAVVIDALRSNYRLKELLSLLRMAKSSYCY